MVRHVVKPNRPLRRRPRGPKFYIRPYKQGSKSAKALAAALSGVVMRLEGSSYRPAPHRKVINWGSGGLPEGLNDPERVRIAGNKLAYFNMAWEAEPDHPRNPPRIPQFWQGSAEANTWLTQANERTKSKTPRKLVVRNTLTGHSGQGIIILEAGAPIPNAPLYVEYIPKDAEYRVHIFNNEVIDVQRKVAKPGTEPTNWGVRSHANGFIFTRHTAAGALHTADCPPDVLEQARRAMAVSGLVFGAVDVLFNKKREAAYVLEINTAPGLEGETVQVYANAIRNYFNQQVQIPGR